MVDAAGIFFDEQLVEGGEELAAEIALEIDAGDDRHLDAAVERPPERSRRALASG